MCSAGSFALREKARFETGLLIDKILHGCLPYILVSVFMQLLWPHNDLRMLASDEFLFQVCDLVCIVFCLVSWKSKLLSDDKSFVSRRTLSRRALLFASVLRRGRSEFRPCCFTRTEGAQGLWLRWP